MTADEAFKTLTENICQQCAYGAHCMDECDIRGCDNRDAIKVLMSCCNVEKTGKWITTEDGRCLCNSCCWRLILDYNLNSYPNYCPRCGAKMEVDE